MKSNTFLLIFIVIFNSCSLNDDSPIKITYKGINKNDCNIDLRNGSVAMYFTSGFENDLTLIYYNDSLISEVLLSTETTTGLASYLNAGNVSNIKSIGIKINNSNLITIKCDSVNQLFLISKSESDLLIESVCYFPRFY